MDQAQFGDFIAQERERLTRERDVILSQQRELQSKLAAVDREFAAIAAYEAAKTGKPIRVARRPSARRTAPGRRRQREGRREAVLELLRQNPHGLKRGEILELMGLKGDRSGGMAVSNVLTALIKAHQVQRRDGAYVIVIQ